MPFGLGFGELVVVLLTLAVPIAVLLLAGIGIARMLGRGSPPAETRQLATELQQAQLRIEELEAKVALVEEKAAFTQQLLEEPRGGEQSRA